MSTKKTGRGSDQFPLRLPDGMRDRIKEAAEKNGRSMNSEIIYLLEIGLEWSSDRSVAFLDSHEQTARDLRESELQRAKIAAERNILLERLGDVRSAPADEGGEEKPQLPSEDRTLYVLLDANGQPTSWQEISLYLGEIGRTAGLEINSLEARIFDAKMASNNVREAEYLRLFRKFKSLRFRKKAD